LTSFPYPLSQLCKITKSTPKPNIIIEETQAKIVSFKGPHTKKKNIEDDKLNKD